MQVDEFFYYKNQLMEDLLTNEDIVRLINEDVSIDDAPSLVYKQVFPYEYMPETVEHGQTFIFSDVDIQRAPNKTFYEPTLYVWVLAHRSKLRLPEGGVRVDKLAAEISKALNGSWRYGLGELDLYSIKRFTPVTDYQGKVMTFRATDFNRPSPTGHVRPSNRRTG